MDKIYKLNWSGSLDTYHNYTIYTCKIGEFTEREDIILITKFTEGEDIILITKKNKNGKS